MFFEESDRDVEIEFPSEFRESSKKAALLRDGGINPTTSSFIVERCRRTAYIPQFRENGQIRAQRLGFAAVLEANFKIPGLITAGRAYLQKCDVKVHDGSNKKSVKKSYRKGESLSSNHPIPSPRLRVMAQ